ncbi:MAG: hypothetical protein JW725_04900 [Candidatus Babeliaceae bacterium]|nr:hypothetical protein [Candidatus Babeliaceae bacterium]
MQTYDKKYSFSVFPFLKTRSEIYIGNLLYRSTDMTDGLSPEQANCVNEIANMLFLQDNLRIKSASYAVVPFVDLRHAPTDVEYLKNVQAVIAYCYASPRHEFGDLFLSSEHASMALFTPGSVSVHLVRPDFNVEATEPLSDLAADHRGEVEGYAGLYNFRHHFWVTKGSRLYGPKPYITINHSQDLGSDLNLAEAARVDCRLLGELLRNPNTRTSSRIFTAVRWFNAANNAANDQATAIVNLSIAFEALLNLPRDEKTDRLTDSISLLLGRTPRLDIWARQFYDARSRIVHEGDAQQIHFVATDTRKKSEGPFYQSLLSYGRQVFQLCLGTVLVGADLAEKARLEEKFITNQERFEKICKLLKNKTIGGGERLESIAPIVAATNQYRYISESDLKLETMIGATRLAAKTLLECGGKISHTLEGHLNQLINAKRTDDHFQELEALQALNDSLTDKAVLTETIYGEPVRDIVKVVWDYTFMHYFWIKERSLEVASSKTEKEA